MQPSRTYALAAGGLLALALALLVLLVLLSVSVATGGEVADLVGAVEVTVGSLAAVAAGGAGSMAVRDYGSRGLTSSQGAVVAAAEARAGFGEAGP